MSMRPDSTECYYYANGRLFYLARGVFSGSFQYDFLFEWNGIDWNVAWAQESCGFFPLKVDGKIGSELKEYDQFVDKRITPIEPFSFKPDKNHQAETVFKLYTAQGKTPIMHRDIGVEVNVRTGDKWKHGFCEITARDDGFYVGQHFIKRGDAESMRHELSWSEALLDEMKDVTEPKKSTRKNSAPPGTKPFSSVLGWEMRTRTAVSVAMAFLYERWYESWEARKFAQSIVSLWPIVGTTIYNRNYQVGKKFVGISLVMR